MSAEYCRDCGGDPRRPENIETHKAHACPTCGGAGSVRSNDVQFTTGTGYAIVTCPDCEAP